MERDTRMDTSEFLAERPLVMSFADVSLKEVKYARALTSLDQAVDQR